MPADLDQPLGLHQRDDREPLPLQPQPIEGGAARDQVPGERASAPAPTTPATIERSNQRGRDRRNMDPVLSKTRESSTTRRDDELRTLPSFIPSRRPPPRQAGGIRVVPVIFVPSHPTGTTSRGAAGSEAGPRSKAGSRATTTGPWLSRRIPVRAAGPAWGGGRHRADAGLALRAGGVAPDVGPGASRAESDAPPQDGQRGPQAGPLDGRPERLGRSPRQHDDLGLDPADPQPSMDQVEEPAGQVPLELAPAVEIQRRTDGGVQLQHAIRVVDPPRRRRSGRPAPRPVAGGRRRSARGGRPRSPRRGTRRRAAASSASASSSRASRRALAISPSSRVRPRSTVADDGAPVTPRFSIESARRSIAAIARSARSSSTVDHRASRSARTATMAAIALPAASINRAASPKPTAITRLSIAILAAEAVVIGPSTRPVSSRDPASRNPRSRIPTRITTRAGTNHPPRGSLEGPSGAGSAELRSSWASRRSSGDGSS